MCPLASWATRRSARMVGSTAEWIFNVSGIEERHFAAEGESVAEMGVAAAKDCLSAAGVEASALGMLLVASGSSERRFPGPAVSCSERSGARWCSRDRSAVGERRLSVRHGDGGASWREAKGTSWWWRRRRCRAWRCRQPLNPATSVLFGDGAGACLISPDRGCRPHRRFGAVHRRRVFRGFEAGVRAAARDERPHRDSASLAKDSARDCDVARTQRPTRRRMSIASSCTRRIRT